MKTLKKFWNFLFKRKAILGKQWVEESMTEEYGCDWLKQALKSLEDPDVRADIKERLKLK